MSGRFITFEGIEGAGKSTQIEILAAALRESGHDVVVTREPGGTPGAEEIRALLVEADAEWGAMAECLLVNAARADHLDNLIRPALAAGSTVLCDRFMDSTRAYQGGAGGIGPEAVAALERAVVGESVPDLTFIFDLPAETGLARATARGAQDRFERKGLAYHEKVRAAFRAIAEAEPGRCMLIDAEQTQVAVAAAIAEALRRRAILV